MKKKATTGQIDFEGNIYNIDEIVSPPEIIERNELKVIHLVISEEDMKTKGFLESALKKARDLSPEVKSGSKPIWMTAQWQAKRRERLANGK